MQGKVFRRIGLLLGLGYAFPAFAHVKWFVDTEEIVAHETLHFRLDDPFVVTWIGILFLAVLVAFLLDLVLSEPSKKLQKKVEKWRPAVFRIFEVFVGLNLFIEAYLGAVIAPPFVAASPFAYALLAVQVLVGFMLLFDVYLNAAAFALLLLYFASMPEFGVMRLLDELFMIGVVAYLVLGRPRKKSWAVRYEEYALPLLRVFTGCSLMILAFTEKFLHPELGLNFLQEFHWNFMELLGVEGFTNFMFVFSAGAMEFLMGLILVLGFIPRINIAFTAIFFSLTFILLGPLELVGHMPIFVTALVIILYGGGKKLNFRNLLPKKEPEWMKSILVR